MLHTLVVARADLRPRLLELIDGGKSPFGGEGRIVLKANAIADAEMVEALYRASTAGVQIDLVIRGIYSLRAAFPDSPRTSASAAFLGRYLDAVGSTLRPQATSMT